MYFLTTSFIGSRDLQLMEKTNRRPFQHLTPRANWALEIWGYRMENQASGVRCRVKGRPSRKIPAPNQSLVYNACFEFTGIARRRRQNPKNKHCGLCETKKTHTSESPPSPISNFWVFICGRFAEPSELATGGQAGHVCRSLVFRVANLR